jgi:predicted nucleic acid-binding protein
VNYIFDINVISELVAAQPNRHVLNWVDSIDPESVYISAITIGELKKGIDKLPASQKKELLKMWLEEDLLIRFSGHILPVDISIALVWGELLARLEGAGTPMPAIDSLLAATAVSHGFTFVTRNTSDFEAAGISLYNPWLEGTE